MVRRRSTVGFRDGDSILQQLNRGVPMRPPISEIREFTRGILAGYHLLGPDEKERP